jgi:hypothetical protein
VLKKGTAVPQMEFDPPSVESLRNKDILIKGQTVFSLCPVEETEVAFLWRQVSGPTRVPASIISSPIPQLLIPANLLSAGSVYQFSLTAAMGDVSQSSESVVQVKIGYQDLIANIAGATRVSSQDALKLSALGSRDPDIDHDGPQGLTYTWSLPSVPLHLAQCAGQRMCEYHGSLCSRVSLCPGPVLPARSLLSHTSHTQTFPCTHFSNLSRVRAWARLFMQCSR